MNYSQWHHTNTPFWLDYADILRQNFDNHTSLKGIIQSNPEIIKKHFLSNISNYSIQTGKVIFSFFAPIFTKNIHWLCLMVSGMLFAIYFSQTKTIKDKRKKFFELVNGNPFTLFVLFILAAPSFIVCIYAYPRAHYILLQVPFLLLVIAWPFLP
jgi:hypothetical protein